MSNLLNIPKPKMPLWCHFSAALVQKAVAQDADGVEGCFAILLKHCADEPGVALLAELNRGTPRRIASTILAALPKDAGAKVAQALKDNPDQRQFVLDMIEEKQAIIREVCADLAEKHPELKQAVA